MWFLLCSLASAADTAAAAPAAAAPASTVAPVAEIRPRFEYSTGNDGAEGNDSAKISQRTRLGLVVGSGPVSVRVVVQDVRLWGEELDTLKDFSAQNLDVHEAYLGWRATDDVNLTVGRQEISLDEERLVGAVNWTQQGRAFDAGRVVWTPGPVGLDAGGAWLESKASGNWEGDGGLGYAHLGIGKDPDSLAALVIVDSDAPSDRVRETAGLYAKGAVGPLSGRVEGYGQAGTAGRDQIGAWMVGAQATVAPEVATKPRATLWLDVLSGDADPGDRKIAWFDTLYATNHKFYGLIDIAGPSDKGLIDACVKASDNPFGKATIDVEGHLFRFEQPRGGDAAYATELDAVGTAPLVDKLQLQIGGAGFFYADDRSADGWVYAQLDAKL